ncbi:6710_t:CDS:1, partial [Racocetra persica]
STLYENTIDLSLEIPLTGDTINSSFETSLTEDTSLETEDTINSSLTEDTINSSLETLLTEDTINSSLETLLTEDTINSSLETSLTEDTINSSLETSPTEDTINSSFETSLTNDTINSSVEIPLTEDEKINIKYCQEKICKFLFPYQQPEQETRANIHTRAYIQLARTLNRTLVLPNVGSSKVKACSLYPFDFYYNVDALQKQYPDIRFITQPKFFEWTKERKVRPIAQHSWMFKDLGNQKIIKVEGVEFGHQTKKSLCIGQFNLNITNYKVIHAGIEKKLNKEVMLKFVTDTLKTPPMTGEYEVIMILNKLPRETFPSIDKVIPYSPYIIKESEKIINKLKPYIAIHWRMESGQPSLIPKCAKNLIKTVKKIQNLYGIKNVYLAGDFPLNNVRTQSETFRKITKFHKEAFKILGLYNSSDHMKFVNSSDHIKFNTWISMDGLSQIRKDPMYNREIKKPGIQGILDKLICINANFFLRGRKGCARVSSSFTSTIIGERKMLKD